MSHPDTPKTNPELKQAILYIYSRQTEAEQTSESTLEDNGIGFNGVDASFLSSLAKQIDWGRELSPKQYEAGWKAMAKYCNTQLADGQWRSVELPSMAPTPDSKRKELREQYPGKQGLLGMADEHNNRLRFLPLVYPSNQIKKLGFKKWDGEAWLQSIGTVNQTVVDDLANMFKDIEIMPEVAEALRVDKVEVPQELKDTHKTVMEFQWEASQFASSTKRSMIALAPGLGKTLASILSADIVGAQRVLIICPKSLLYNWRAELMKWGSSPETISIWHGKKFEGSTRWTITTYDMIRLRGEKFTEVEWDAVIGDESVLVKNRKAQRTKALGKFLTQVKAPHVWFLTGSPTTKYLDDMWSQLHLIDPKRFSAYWKFAEKYCIVEHDQWGWKILGNQPGAIDRIKHDLRDVYFARTQDQVLDLPDWIVEDVEVPMAPGQDKLYQEMEDQFLARLSEENTLLAPNVLAQMTRLIQIASNPLLIGGKDMAPKWDAVLDMLTYEQGPFIIWTSYIDTAEALSKRIAAKKHTVATLTGRTPALARQEAVDQFQAGELDVIIAHPAVGKFGFTLTKARTAIYVERQWMADDYIQSLHRIRRIGTEHSPHVIHVKAIRSEKSGMGPTVDHVIGSILASRKENTLALTTGDLKSMFLGEHHD